MSNWIQRKNNNLKLRDLNSARNEVEMDIINESNKATNRIIANNKINNESNPIRKQKMIYLLENGITDFRFI